VFTRDIFAKTLVKFDFEILIYVIFIAVFTKEEQRAVIRFFWSEYIPGAEILRRLETHYGDHAMSRISMDRKVSK